MGDSMKETLKEFRKQMKQIDDTKKEEGDKQESGVVQWLPTGKKYIPCGMTVSKLPAGIYSLRYDRSVNQYLLQEDDLHLDDLLILPDMVTEKVLKDIRSFWSLQESYEKLNCVYKRGILLYGEPGCGKTSIIMLLAKELIDNDGIVINILNMDNVDELKETLNTLRKIEPDRRLIVIIEDIDNFMGDRDGTLTELLNLLDGGLQLPNIVILATTNFPERLQKRISHRPSRFDRRYEVGLPSATARKYYIQKKLSDEDFKKISLGELIKRTAGFTIDHLKELLLSVFVLGYDFEEAYKEIKGMMGNELLKNTNTQKGAGFNQSREDDDDE